MKDFEYINRGKPVLNARTRQIIDESLKATVISQAPAFAQEHGLEDMTMEDMSDMMRGSLQRCPVGAYADLLSVAAGWIPRNVDRERLAEGGDYLFSLSVAGEILPAFFFPAYAMPFDDTDPLKSFYVMTIGETAGRFLLMHPMPTFKLRHTADGRITKVLIHGGWLVDEGLEQPFVLSSRGSDDIPNQARYYTSSNISSGFYRDRALDSAALDKLFALQAALDAARKKVDIVGMPTATGDLQLATGAEGWSKLIDRSLMEMLESMNVLDI